MANDTTDTAAALDAARRFAEETWGAAWTHAEMGSLLEFAALVNGTSKPSFEDQMKVARHIMTEHRDVLEALAKS